MSAARATAAAPARAATGSESAVLASAFDEPTRACGPFDVMRACGLPALAEGAAVPEELAEPEDEDGARGAFQVAGRARVAVRTQARARRAP